MKDKVDKIVNNLHLEDGHSRMIIVMVICDICRMFEHQIILLSKEGSKTNLTLFAKAIVSRAINYIAGDGYEEAENINKKMISLPVM